MSRSFAGEMKKALPKSPEASNHSTSTLQHRLALPPFFAVNTALPPRPVPGQAKQLSKGRPPHLPRRWDFHSRSRVPGVEAERRSPLQHTRRQPTPARQHAGEVKGASLNSHAPHAVPSDCSFPGLPRGRCQLPAARCRAWLCVWPSCLPVLRTSCGKQLTMAGRAGPVRFYT